MTLEDIEDLKVHAVPPAVPCSINYLLDGFTQVGHLDPKYPYTLHFHTSDNKRRFALLNEQNGEKFVIYFKDENIILYWLNENGDITHQFFMAMRRISKGFLEVDGRFCLTKTISLLKIPYVYADIPEALHGCRDIYNQRDVEVYEDLYRIALSLTPLFKTPLTNPST